MSQVLDRYFTPTADRIHVNDLDTPAQTQRATRALADIRNHAATDFSGAIYYADRLIEELRTNHPAQQAAVATVTGLHSRHLRADPTAFGSFSPAFYTEQLHNNKSAQELVTESAIGLYGDLARQPVPLATHFYHATPASPSAARIETASNLAVVSSALVRLTAALRTSPDLQEQVAPHVMYMNRELAKTEPETASRLATALTFATAAHPPLQATAAAAAITLHAELPVAKRIAAEDELAIAVAPLLAGRDLERHAFRSIGFRTVEPWGTEAQIAIINKESGQIAFGDFKGTLAAARQTAEDLANPAKRYKAGHYCFASDLPKMIDAVAPLAAAKPDAALPSLAATIAALNGPGRPRALSPMEQFVGPLAKDPRFMEALGGASRALDDNGVAPTLSQAVSKPQPGALKL